MREGGIVTGSVMSSLWLPTHGDSHTACSVKNHTLANNCQSEPFFIKMESTHKSRLWGFPHLRTDNLRDQPYLFVEHFASTGAST